MCLCVLYSLTVAVFWLLSSADACSGDVNYTVKPAEGSMEPCPEPCLTLAEIAIAAADGLFVDSSNVTMTLLPGKHYLNTTLKLSHGTCFALIGGDQPQSYSIVYSGPASISIDHFKEIIFNSFSFNLNGINNFTITATQVEHMSFFRLFVTGRVKTLLYVNLSSFVSIQNCIFTGINTTSKSLFYLLKITVTFANNTVSYNTLQYGSFISLRNTSLTFANNNVSNNILIYSTFAYLPKSSLMFASYNTVNNNTLSSSTFTKLWNGLLQFADNTVRNNRLKYGTFINLQNGSLTFANNTMITNILRYSKFANLLNVSIILAGENVAFNNSNSCTFAFWCLDSSNFTLKDQSNFSSNSMMLLSVSKSNITVEGNMIISQNSDCLGQVWGFNEPVFNFRGSVVFSDNYGGDYGGAMFISHGTIINVFSNSNIVFRNNSAGRRGGAIFVDDVSTCNSRVQEPCFMQFPEPENTNISILFEYNRAPLGGEDIYGGNVLNCKGKNILSNDYVKFMHTNKTLSHISSSPKEVCFCEENRISCCPSQGRYRQCDDFIELKEVFPGQSIHLSVIAVGQNHGAVPSEVRILAYENSLDLNSDLPVLALDFGLKNLIEIQFVNATCTDIPYHINSLKTQKLSLYTGGTCDLSSSLNVATRVSSTCPPGFDLYENNMQCDCERRLKEHASSVQCNIDNQTFMHDNHVWIGYHGSSGVIIHSVPCPFDYCREGELVSFPLNRTDEQCRNHRTGVICGRCEDGYSIILGGTSQCRQCSSAYLGLILPFAVCGLVLIAIIFLLKMTVKYGTLSGVVFYANIVQVNRTVFLPEGQTNILTVFVAWLDLDIGINTCFYDGLDAYGKTWLQFVFPFYIWIIIGAIILASHLSTRVTKAFGSSPVSVLATLFLLSYVKILRTCINVFSITSVEYSTGTEYVWKLDGNIKYFTGKHVPLFLFSLVVFILLFLPFTVLLLFGQWMQYVPKWKFLPKYMQWLSHFLDAYHAPYKHRHRYWTGLLLVVRVILTGISSLTHSDDNIPTSSSITVVILLLLLWGWLNGGIYQNWLLDILECSFMINLSLLTFGNNNSQTNTQKTAVAYVSMSVAFVTFVMLVVYHMYHQVRKLHIVQLQRKPSAESMTDPKIIPSAVNKESVSKTVVAIEDNECQSYREPVLDNTEFGPSVAN